MGKHGLMLGSKFRNITIFGAGKSGIAAAKRLLGLNIFISESSKIIDGYALRWIKSHKIAFESGGHTDRSINKADLIVVSPGVPLNIPVLKKAKALNIPIIGEIELACSFIKKPIIAITGTNGKTTTTTLLGKILNDSGKKAAVAGNIGDPLILVRDSNFDYVVAEISSYQLETIRTFKPYISVILNITEDHLTRHGTMNEYSNIKSNIFNNQGKSDHLIYNIDDRLVKAISIKARCHKVPISLVKKQSKGAYVSNENIYFKDRSICEISNIRLKGEHNIQNVLAAVSAAMICGVPVRSIVKTLKSFKGVEHRIEFVRNKSKISFYNDSKGTNPDSTLVAIKTLKPSHGIILILGGRDKMTDLSPLCISVKESVKKVILIGEAKARFKKALIGSGYKNIHEAQDLERAVKDAYKFAEKGDAVLLSPACASFDMFRDFEERGKVFKQIVAKL